METRVLTSGIAATPVQIAAAMRRAVAEGIQVRRINTSNIWTASSGRDESKAYELVIHGGAVVSCSCKAGEFGNYCKHRAAWELAKSMGQVEA